jgi:SAM-dependent methyltransferase
MKLEAIASTAPRPDAPLIDVGGGSSRLTAALLDAGHSDITVLDLSEAALDLARGRLGPRADMVTWLAADLLTWQPTRQYAIWHDRAVLHFFTDPADRSRYVDNLRAALMSGGHAIIATFAPGGPEHCSGLPVPAQLGAGDRRSPRPRLPATTCAGPRAPDAVRCRPAVHLGHRQTDALCGASHRCRVR